VRLRQLMKLVAERYPDLAASVVIEAGCVVVNGRVITNPASLVPEKSSVRLRSPVARELRGERKLRDALSAFAVVAAGCVALDLGAAAGGFTRALLAAGARRVYAVDAGFGQLLGSLRQDARVINLERTNLAELDRILIPDTIDVVTADLSYIRLAVAIPQVVEHVDLSARADLVALIKPQFELALRNPPSEGILLRQAVQLARQGIEQAGWQTQTIIQSPLTGRRGSIEFLLHARRVTGDEANSPPHLRPPNP
jgi:23S rRNA (cytidine1920-2'-O)/16S rRNA (cytidine1409-2'-O)-methyltransferase